MIFTFIFNTEHCRRAWPWRWSGGGYSDVCSHVTHHSVSRTGKGVGVLVFPGGDRYEGAFEVGKFHGYRVFHSASDMRYEVS